MPQQTKCWPYKDKDGTWAPKTHGKFVETWRLLVVPVLGEQRRGITGSGQLVRVAEVGELRVQCGPASAKNKKNLKREERAINEHTCMCIHLWTRTCEHVYTHGHTTIHIHINNKKERQVQTQRLEKERGVNPASQGLGGSKRPLQQAGICRMPVCGCRRRQGSREADQGGKAEAFKGLLRSWDLMLCVVN